MLNNIVDNLEQCGQQNIVQCCFHQARTGCSFLLCRCFEQGVLRTDTLYAILAIFVQYYGATGFGNLSPDLFCLN